MSGACYVYAIVGRHMPLPPSQSDGGAELAMVPCRELAAVTRTLGDCGAPLTADAVLHHEAVVEAVRREGPALPVRFGTVFRDATSVASALADHYEPLAADLDRLGDKVELSLTALWLAPTADAPPLSPPPQEPAPDGRGAGARYLYERAAEHRRFDDSRERARVLARELDRSLGGLALERRLSLLPTPRIAVRAAYLLDPACVGAFRSAFEVMRQSRERELRVLLTGPWPPYTFVRQTETESPGRADGRLTALARLLNETMQGRPG